MTGRRRPGRVQLTLRDGERDALAALAAIRHEPEATTAARLIRLGLIDGGASLDAVVRNRTAPQHGHEDRPGSGTAPWLPPARLTDAIEALRDRYPHELRHLRSDLLNIPAAAEPAAALAVWRARIDAGRHDDPRAELGFAYELHVFSRRLQEQRLDRRTPRAATR